MTSSTRQTYGHLRNWSARLGLFYEHRFGRTVLSDTSFEGPLRVQRAFYPEGDVCHTYILHPPGGMVSGDELAINLRQRPLTHVLATTPSAGKIYCADAEGVCQKQHITAEISDGILEWLPQETIVFDGARANLSTRFELYGASKLITWEIVGLGRQAGQLPFQHGSLAQNGSIAIDDTPCLIEGFVLDESLMLMDTALGLMGKPYFGTMYFVNAGGESIVSRLRATLEDAKNPYVLSAVTSKPNLVMVRALADDAEALRTQFAHLWARCRQPFLGRKACPPRIWFT